MGDDVLHPSEVSVTDGRNAKLPTLVLPQAFTSPFFMLKGGLARMKSALRPGKRSLWKVSPCSIWLSIPRMARFILARRHVV